MLKKLFTILIVAATLYAAYKLLIVENVSGNDSALTDGAKVKQKVLTFSIDGRTSKGIKNWHLEGKAAEIFGDEIHLEDLKATVFGENFTADLFSDRGIYNKSTSEVELDGNVKVISDDDVELRTEKAKWSHLTKEITTAEYVQIDRKDMYAEGIGARANSEQKTATLLRDVKVRMEPSTDIECSGALEASFNENTAIFNENVHVKDKDGDLFADLLTVTIDPETHKIAMVVAEGNVKLVRGRSSTVCGKATYTDGTRSVKFVGKPRVIIAPEEMEDSGFLSSSGFGGDVAN